MVTGDITSASTEAAAAGRAGHMRGGHVVSLSCRPAQALAVRISELQYAGDMDILTLHVSIQHRNQPCNNSGQHHSSILICADTN